MKNLYRSTSLCLALALALAACGPASAERPIEPVSHVQLSRYMGRWYVIASIPTRFGRDGYNQVETYHLEPDGEICTSFRFHRGGFQGPLKTIHSTATVIPGSGNAQWQVHLFWLLRLQYLVAWLAPDYSRVIVARDARDYVWLMARTPRISASDYRRMVERVRAMGYDVGKLRKVPQRWTSPDDDRQPHRSVCR
ncbi:MAG TPA: lipocalin family protein [Steroidobacteraceae bacterium]|nr:lipocalin family protein [Steroidobacteraceae bacterium]